MKKILVIVGLFIGASVFAGPHGPGPGPCPPPHYRGDCHYRGSDGVWLAAGITGIVANSLNILNSVQPKTQVIYQQPVVQQTVPVVQQTQPTYQYVPVQTSNGQILYQKVLVTQPSTVVIQR